MINASCFSKTTINPHCTVYSSSSSNYITISSLEDAFNPANYRSLFHPFAYVIVNKETNDCLLVRDHLGIHPLYYCYHKEKLIFADNLPDILIYMEEKPSLLNAEVEILFSDERHYSDNTIYHGIYRVEPGHMVHFKPDGSIEKKSFWGLKQEGETLHYRDDREYLEHFSELMRESIQHNVQGSSSIAAEFSAGMDSTAVYGTCAHLGLNPELFMHAPLPGSNKEKNYDDFHERAFIKEFPSAVINRIIADDFDPIHIFKESSACFAGPSPYMFELFAHNIHRAVSSKGHEILLSGFGGDQGVSSHIPARFILPELLHNKEYIRAWVESAPANMRRRLMLIMQYAHPEFHGSIQRIQDLKLNISNTFKKNEQKKIATTYPYHRHYFKTLREQEWSFLQGPNSHEIRMRIEYSSIVAKNMGFEYRYPLLHPKLLEFFLSLPLEQKRHHGVGRYMMRRYLMKLIPKGSFHDHKKKDGLHIMPATMDAFETQWGQNVFQNEFQNLPFAKLITGESPQKIMIKTIQAFMLNESQKNNPTP